MKLGGMAYGYFSNLDNSDHYPDRPLIEVFQRLAVSRQWKERGKLYRKERQKCFAQEFGLHFNQGKGTLGGWQDLCKDLSIEPVPESIKKCKTVGPRGRLCLNSPADFGRPFRRPMSILLI